MYFLPTMVCWRCKTRDASFPASYSMALITSSKSMNPTAFVDRVERFENCGRLLDSFSGFCDECMSITLHTCDVRQRDGPPPGGYSQKETLMFSLHYLQNQLLEMDRLHKFSLLM
jgi:hypothetical protein